jgi:tetratricopeptide (TPR) repeat protein
MPRTTATAIVTCLLILGAAPRVQAEDLRVKAKQIFEQGEARYQAGDFAAALKKYKATLEIRRHPSIIFNIAQCYRKLGDAKQGLFYYKLFLDDWARSSPDAPPPNEDEVKDHITKLQAIVDSGGSKPHQPEVKPQPRPRPTQPATTPPAPKKRSVVWLSAGIGASAAAVGGLALGVAYNVLANREVRDSSPFKSKRTISLVGYISGGVLAAAAAAGWYMWYRSGVSTEATAVVLPLEEGALVSAGLRF